MRKQRALVENIFSSFSGFTSGLQGIVVIHKYINSVYILHIPDSAAAIYSNNCFPTTLKLLMLPQSLSLGWRNTWYKNQTSTLEKKRCIIWITALVCFHLKWNTHLFTHTELSCLPLKPLKPEKQKSDKKTTVKSSGLAN